MLNNWDDLFNQLKKKDYFRQIESFLNDEYKNHVVYPPKDLMFNAFKLTNPNTLKVVIIGQDPYHEENQAMGLAFSVPNNQEIPPSLKNIYQEIENEYNVVLMQSGDLTYLAKQGCLLLNTVLTVRAQEALSHDIKEYKMLTKDILEYIDKLNQPIVFMLWGNHAKQYEKLIHNKNRLILTANHPSPLSANRGGWFNNNHFKLANNYLLKNKIKAIDWINNY